ncbi:YceI family protein [Ekhidna sp.]|uniref:YceI family protein n=1 Tax=Ekhidna sp. TaxID=2608089 RepID=UPI003298B619
MKTRFKAILIVLLFTVTIPSLAQTYTVDAGHSSFQSKVIRFGVVPVVGRFNDVSGVVIFDETDLSKTKATITIKTESYEANNDAGEDAVKSAAFLNAAAFPVIRFELTSLTGDKDNYVARGTLEIHGVKKEIECPVSILGPSIDLPTKKQSVGIIGNLAVDRTEFDVGREMKLPNGMVIIDNTVMINFVILGIAE